MFHKQRFEKMIKALKVFRAIASDYLERQKIDVDDFRNFTKEEQEQIRKQREKTWKKMAIRPKVDVGEINKVIDEVIGEEVGYYEDIHGVFNKIAEALAEHFEGKE